MKRYLFKTAGNTLLYCNPNDSIWGTGSGKPDTASFPGENKLGKMLMEVRDELMKAEPKQDYDTNKNKRQAPVNFGKEMKKPKISMM